MSENKKQPKDQEFLVDNRENIVEKDNEINERINRLFGESDTVQKKELKDYDPNELQKIRKKLLFLLIGVIIAGVVIIVLLLNPLEFNFGKTSTTNSPQEENNNSTDIPNEIEYPIDLDLYSEKVVLLNQKISFSIDDLKTIDLFPLFMNKTTISKDIPNNIKLLMLTKDENFYAMLMNNGIEEYVKSCNQEGVAIDKNDFDKVVEGIYDNETTIDYDSINYEFFTKDYNSKKIILTFNNDKYIVKCNDYSVNNKTNKLLQQKLIKAKETETDIELYQKVVFISYEGNIGVYKEPAFKTLITNDKTAEFDNYIEKGSTYKYTFKKNENSYNFSKIELIEEDN